MAYFISETYLKTNTNINNNVDITELVPHIQDAEQMFLRPLLGEDFFDDIKSKYDAQTLSAIEVDLVALIKPALSYRTFQISLSFISVKIKNIGVVVQKADYADAAELNRVHYLEGNIEERAVHYENRIVEFIEDNLSSFPLYQSDCDNETDQNNGFIFY